MDDATGPLAAGNDFGTRAKQTQQTQGGGLLDDIHCVAGNQQLRYVIRKRFGHVTTADIGDALQRQIHVNRIARVQVVLDALDDQLDQVAVGVDQHRDEQVSLDAEKRRTVNKSIGVRVEGAHDLLLGIFVRGEQVDRLHVAEVDVVAKQEYEQQFAHIFLLLVAVQRLVTFEFASDVRELFVDALHFGFFALACNSSSETKKEMPSVITG